MDRIPILRMGNFLLVTIQVDMHDQLAMTLQEDLTTAISKHGSGGVLIDISSLEIVDSFIGRMLAHNGKDAPVEGRLYGTLASQVVLILKGAHIIRTHDVKPAVETARIADAILQAR